MNFASLLWLYFIYAVKLFTLCFLMERDNKIWIETCLALRRKILKQMQYVSSHYYLNQMFKPQFNRLPPSQIWFGLNSCLNANASTFQKIEKSRFLIAGSGRVRKHKISIYCWNKWALIFRQWKFIKFSQGKEIRGS